VKGTSDNQFCKELERINNFEKALETGN